jgi:hypothetical protein
MDECRCEQLNVLSGDVARDLRRRHLESAGIDGMGRALHRCPDTGIEWLEERDPTGYSGDTVVLRRRTR